MKPNVSFSIVLSLLLTIADWMIGSNQKFTTVLAGEALTDTCVPVGRIISVQGVVQMKRQGWQSFQRTAVGAELCLGDLLQPAKGARVIVRCADSTQEPWIVADGKTSGAAMGCRQPAAPRTTRSGPISPLRSETVASRRIPYIISPRSTLLLNPLPTLRWNAVDGANSYTVRVRGEGLDWVKPDVNGTEVIYSGQPLKPGVYYSLIVETDTGRFSLEEDLPGLGFKLLDDKEREQVQAATNQRANEKLDEEAKALSLADLYIGNDLKAEAIEVLEALVKKGSKTAAIHRTLGKLYGQVGLSPLAAEHYLKAIELSSAQDIEGQALAAAGLGEVNAALGATDKAIQYLNLALTRYETLGDSQRVSELKNQLTKLVSVQER